MRSQEVRLRQSREAGTLEDELRFLQDPCIWCFWSGESAQLI